MPRLLPLILAAAMAPLGIAQADELTIEGVGISRDVDCHGKDVGVYGAENEIALTGRCGLISVHGSKHKVSFEEGRALFVSGMDNTVQGGRAQDVTVSVTQNIVTATLGGGSPPGKLDTSGANNRVSLVLAGPTQLQVNGADHVVEWTRSEGAPNPEVTASGAKNVIKRKP
ncbi:MULTISPECIES: DUF3060 domain-containing protein [Methylorubrum]|uniref:DUF3060 domain-containing protein n=1 Tax=Methylorubrum TaxID=2282523 RepID=UPI00209E6B1B|nr:MULTISPECIES: DUF3060 domain-containing protein [Methylorubrum]MCP1548081.1 hypothetical protein [Methylorubrum zatmanii]MCP1555304.1 hypothetical protein [Methylorubrum extorquens]MCP1578384.1 hypothetical protein [Methylorubrum extorquens]